MPLSVTSRKEGEEGSQYMPLCEATRKSTDNRGIRDKVGVKQDGLVYMNLKQKVVDKQVRKQF